MLIMPAAKRVESMRSFLEQLHLAGEDGVTLSAQRDPQGWTITLGRSPATYATIEPLILELPDRRLLHGEWTSVQQAESALVAEGSILHENTTVSYTLRLACAPAAHGVAPLELAWQITFDAMIEGALLFPLNLHEIALDPTLIDLPAIHYGRVSYGSGLFPHPDPRTGFAFRADRMAQPALHLRAPDATWSYFTPCETPEPPVPEQMYALGIVATGSQSGAHIRYPQHEFGHRGDGGPDAYVAKDLFAPGERAYHQFAPGTALQATCFVQCSSPDVAASDAAIMRWLWQRAANERESLRGDSLLHQADQRLRWLNRRLYNPSIGGGQYESPEGSNTAILGFVEQSLLMASTTLRFTALHKHPPADFVQFREQALGALTRWATAGRSPEGLLYPVCDRSGYGWGFRRYSDYEQLSIGRDDGFETIRLATEARSLLGAAAGPGLRGAERDQAQPLVAAALATATWLHDHRLPAGGYAARYHHSGAPLDAYPSGTGAVLGLFCDCARSLAARNPAASREYAAWAEAAYQDGLRHMIEAGVFAGGTLDASCPDREAAIAALDACLNLYELTDNERYLRAAQLAADNILSYTLVYSIRTFGPDTDARRRQISTFGATIVSPENQHLDPVATAPGLLLYGLYANDPVAIEAAIESLRWTLDGRWAISEAEGIKQTEQLLHTRWYYNTFFAQRGDYRRGMPIFGRSDSEHGWPQVVPVAAFLGTGQIVLDWRTRRAAAVDGWNIAEVQPGADSVQLTLTSVGASAADQMLLKVVRLPEQATVQVAINGAVQAITTEHLLHGTLLPVPAAERVAITLKLSARE